MKQYSDKEIRKVIDEMDLNHKIGQLFLLAYPGKDPESIRPLIEKYGICGCYISQDNAETFQEASEVSASLQLMALETPQKIPLMLGVDQEGAWGVLVPESHTGPGNLALGAVSEPSHIGDMYGVFGKEMLSAGYNALLGPCADVNIDPTSPIIGTRSFGEFPRKVADSVAEAVRGAAKTGILTTLKHFPGHGGTSGDTHRVIPEVDKSLEELMETDLLPFKAGIDAGADIIMTSHIRYPQIDPEYPATLSGPILKGLLRKDLGFEGVILSDSMNMGAIRRFYDPAESTLMALNAGVDIVMLSEEHYDHSVDYLPKQIASLEHVKKAVEEGRFTEEDLNEKLFRILDLKLNGMLLKTSSLSSSEMAYDRRIEDKAAKAAFMLLQKGLWPLPESGKILCINATPSTSYSNLMNGRGIGPNQAESAFSTLKKTLESLGAPYSFLTYEEAKALNEKEYEKVDALIVVTEDYPLPGEDFEKEDQQALVKDLAARYGDKTVILGLRSSYELALYPENVTYLCSGSSRSCSARQAAEILIRGERNFTAEPPVTPRTQV